MDDVAVATGRGTIRLLGRVAIARDDGPDTAVRGGRRAELVFAYLAAEHERQVSHDELADALWPEGLPDTWEAALRGVLTEVRRFLSEAGLDPSVALVTARRGNQLQLPTTVSVDLDLARSAVRAARRQLANNEARAAAVAAAEASRLARLPFLPAHDGEWVDAIRRELAQLNSGAMEVEARAHAATGDFPAAAGAAERLVAADPFNEGAHQLRIKILGQAGDRSGAIRAFEHCRTVLDAELGVEPSDETKAALRAATASPAPPAASDQLDGLTMLVVEDHDFQRRTAVMLLRKLGVGTVTEAADGSAALALLRDSAGPDVILCDVDMPGMDGVEFIRHVAEQELAGAVIIASALDSKVVQAVRSVGEGYGLQVLGALAKPLTARALTDLLATYRRAPRSRAARPADGSITLTAAEARAALSEGRIAIHVQPGVDVATGLVTWADALPQWLDARARPLPTDSFRQVLHRAGLLADLSGMALDTSCDCLVACAAQGLDLDMTVPLASEWLDDTALADRASGAASQRGADPARVTFALDERALRNAPGSALDVLTRLRVKGFGVAIDNFGSGTAPAEQLRRVPFTQARLAPALVAGAGQHAQRADALEGIAELARTFDVALVGTGCESEDDFRLLLELGCGRVLGSFIAPAMPAAELGGWAIAWHPGRLSVGERE